MSEKLRVLDILKEMNISPKRSLGQNFLVDISVIEKIIFSVDYNKNIVEVGPGLGALTRYLVEKSKNLTLIELDKAFSEYWRGTGQNVIEQDALKINWEQSFSESSYCLVSNLPYQISSSIVIDRSIQGLPFEEMVLMFQKEVAQRITSENKCKSYGLLSVVAQTFWDIKKVCDVGPKSFYPPPNVASRVLKFNLKHTDTYLKTKDQRKQYLSYLKAAFAQRRKLLVKNLGPYLGSRGQSKEILPDIFDQLGLSQKARAEELTPEQFCNLYRVLSEAD